MAHPIQFTPAAVDPRQEMMRRVAAAPREHAEAVLVLWDLLQSAHDQGLLDAMHGAVTAKDTIFKTVAEFARTPEAIAALRNLVSAAKLLSAVDPERLQRVSDAVAESGRREAQAARPPSLFELARRSAGADSRRGLAYLLDVLAGVGGSLRR